MHIIWGTVTTSAGFVFLRLVYQRCQFLWIVLLYLPLWYSLTFRYSIIFFFSLTYTWFSKRVMSIKRMTSEFILVCSEVRVGQFILVCSGVRVGQSSCRSIFIFLCSLLWTINYLLVPFFLLHFRWFIDYRYGIFVNWSIQTSN